MQYCMCYVYLFILYGVQKYKIIYIYPILQRD